MKKRSVKRDRDIPSVEDVDWNSPQEDLEFDPVLVETVRQRSKLKPVSIRLDETTIAAARQAAKGAGVKYQQVLRLWIAKGARDAHVRLPEKKRRSA